jgi:phosphatidylserine/phosphatidylglycerophosphate/cardiolipin synthase-like enzyme
MYRPMPSKSIYKLVLFLSLSSCITAANAESYFSADTSYEVCFTPGQDCTSLIVKSINQAKQTIHVQAYSFTSAVIAQALVDAKRRGIDVEVILDKSQSKENKYTSATFFLNNNIPTWIDYRPAIAHNKVMIIDKKEVITGSFNFTKAAQHKNAENLLIINNIDLAKKYFDNWENRLIQSRKSNPVN